MNSPVCSDQHIKGKETISVRGSNFLINLINATINWFEINKKINAEHDILHQKSISLNN